MIRKRMQSSIYEDSAFLRTLILPPESLELGLNRGVSELIYQFTELVV